MKKKISVVICAVLLALVLPACGASCSPTEVTDRMDVQRLWKEVTGMDGYPQACLVAKSELVMNSGGFVNDFVNKLKSYDGWAEQDPAAAVEAVHSHMADGSESTTPSVTADIVKRCHIATRPAASEKAAVEAYLECFLDMDGSSIGNKLPDADFYASPENGGTAPASVKVFMPDGATALALAPMMKNDASVSGANVTYTVVPSSMIGSKVMNGEADLAVVPSNLAAKLYNGGKGYKLVATLTHGNLYIVGGDMDGAQSLVGKRVGVIQKGNVPDLVLRYILKNKNIEYVESDVAVAGKVALQYKTNGAEIAALFSVGKIDFGMLAEPAASTVYDKIHEDKAA